ncbi:hypothetical protein [Hymenobacter sp. AT01-02]|uniref:hypothetical protein n=1 Tax=Hymenobacter sp. AT01-02 TaxID=1571877 RepID=UPI0006E2325C|nr:hypothetical protein [Hymenobacter sp. AT01-02]
MSGRFISCLLFMVLKFSVLHPAVSQPATIQASVEVNRILSLVRYVEVVAGGKGYRGVRQQFEQSAFNTPAAQAAIRRYQQLPREVDFQWPDYPADRLGSSGSSWNLFIKCAADAKDLPDLQQRAVGLMPNQTLVELSQVYQALSPAFEELLWYPYQTQLTQEREAYQAYLDRKQLLKHFTRLRTFYGSSWPNEVPYRIMLSPLPGPATTFTNSATVASNIVLLDCHPASTDFVSGSTVMFHEMSHSLSMQQRQELQQQMERWYQHSGSPAWRYAYSLMEEGLATAAGEWIYKQQAGQTESGEWYHDDYIDRYAKAIYPQVESYIANGRTIDSVFVRQVVATFDATFPYAATEYVNLFRKALYWTDTDPAAPVLQPFRDAFRSTYTLTSTPILNKDKTLATAKEGVYLPIIIITQEHAATLRYLQKNWPS